ncbi:MAG: hypothetical protein AAF725_17765, partial [Acidobacteriota bacterium]
MTSSSSSAAVLSRVLNAYEMHRQGLGLLPARGGEAPPGEAPASAIWVVAHGSPRPLRSCTCRGSKGGKTCEHLRALGPGTRIFVEELGGDWRPAFERSLWHRLAKRLYAGSQLPTEAVRIQRIERPESGETAIRVLDASGAEVLDYLDASPARLALLERLGKIAADDAALIDRAALLERLAIFQVSEADRLMEKRGGVRSRGREWESSFWYRLAYHAVRSWGDVAWSAEDPGFDPGGAESGGTFHPAIDRGSGAFTLKHRLASGRATVRIAVPRSRVQAVLELLAGEFPQQADLQIHPVPLQALFRATHETELDLRVRPVLRMLQANGEERFFSRDDFEKFRYGNLYFIRELGVLAKLPKKEDLTRRFEAPRRMRLARSQIPAFLDDHAPALEGGALVLDAPLQGLKIWRSYDRVEVSGELAGDEGATGSASSSTYRLSVTYGFGDQSVSLAELLRARRDNQPYLETATGWVDLRSPALAELARLEEKLGDGEKGSELEGEDDDGVFLSAGELLRFQAAAERPLEISGTGEDRGSLLRRLLDQRPPAPFEAPDGFCSVLRDYQRLGVDWLRFLAEQRLGGLLCDDMGLG